MFLSIIIPVYNTGKYLDECLKSCLNQNIDSTDYEIICINDGSKDNSLNILKKYAKKYPNIVVIDKPNSGVSETRNKGIGIAQGEYIWFVDSDDFIKPNCLKHLKSVAEEKYDVINFGAYAFNEVFTEKEKMLFENNQMKANKTYWGYACFHLYKRNIIINNKISLITEIKYGEDEMFYNDVFQYSENICNLEDALYFYRKNPSSAMNNLLKRENQIKRLESVILSMEILKNGLERGRYTKEFTKDFLKDRYELVKYCFKRLDLKTSIKYFKMMKTKKLFNISALPELCLPSEYNIKSTYIKEHFKIWKRAYYKKTRTRVKNFLPKSVVRGIKKLFKLPD